MAALGVNGHAELLAERVLMQRILSANERDRRLVAYEIHDGLVQDATGAQMHLERLLGADDAELAQGRDELQLAAELIRKAVTEARRLIGGLRPPVVISRATAERWRSPVERA